MYCGFNPEGRVQGLGAQLAGAQVPTEEGIWTVGVGGGCMDLVLVRNDGEREWIRIPFHAFKRMELRLDL